MGVTASELSAIVEALAPRLAGARLRKIHQPRPHELVLGLRADEGDLLLLLSIHPRHARLHLLDAPRRNPPSPPAFTMTLRRDVEGARIQGLEILGGDRVVALDLLRGATRFRLVGELFGGRAALLLLTEDDRVHAATRVELAGGRSARPGESYVLPDPPPHPPAPVEGDPGAIHEAVAAREEVAEERLRIEEARRVRDRALAREQKKLEKLVRRLAEDVTHLPDADLCRRRGAALKTALSQVPRGAAEVTLTEWTEQGARPILVPLDPRRDARTNMERWFRRARRSERAAEHLAERLETARARIDELVERREALRTAEDPAALEPAPPPPPKPSRRKSERTAGIPCFTSVEGHDILVGRSAEENDIVTFRLGRGSDTWLHVRDRPGAHVVVRTPRERPPSLETLLDAAVLAVHHSSARGSSGVEVSYTLRKHVRRMRGAPRGTVSLSGERSIRVDPDEERLARLYGTRREVTAP